MYIHALVTIVLERAWAALKCDQLPVPECMNKNSYENVNTDDMDMFCCLTLANN